MTAAALGHRLPQRPRAGDGANAIGKLACIEREALLSGWQHLGVEWRVQGQSRRSSAECL